MQKTLVPQGKMCTCAIEALKKRKIPGFFNRAVQKGLFFPRFRLLSRWSESKELEWPPNFPSLNWLSKRDVKNVMDSLVDVGHKELKKNGIFLVPGFAKFVVVKKPATKARKGTNPFTGEEMMFKAKPARKIVRARPVKAAKDAVA